MLDTTNYTIITMLDIYAKTLAKKITTQGFTIDDLMPMERAKYQAAEIAVSVKNVRSSYGFAQARRANEQAYVDDMHKIIMAEFIRRNDANIISDQETEIEFSTSKKTLPKTLRFIETLDRHSLKSIMSDKQAFARFLFDAHAIMDSKQTHAKKKSLAELLQKAVSASLASHREYMASIKPQTDDLRTRILNAHNQRYRVGAPNAYGKFDFSDEKLAEILVILNNLDADKIASLKKDFNAYNEFCLDVYQGNQLSKLTSDVVDKKLNKALNIPEPVKMVKLPSFLTQPGIAKIHQQPEQQVVAPRRVTIETVKTQRPVEEKFYAPVVYKKPSWFRWAKWKLQPILSNIFNQRAFAPAAAIAVALAVMPTALSVGDNQQAIDTADVTAGAVINPLAVAAVPALSPTVMNTDDAIILPSNDERALIPMASALPVIDTAPDVSGSFAEVQTPVGIYSSEQRALLESALRKAQLEIALKKAEAEIVARDNTVVQTPAVENSGISMTFENIPQIVTAYYEDKDLEVPSFVQGQLDKFEYGQANDIKGHVAMAAYDAVLEVSKTDPLFAMPLFQIVSEQNANYVATELAHDAITETMKRITPQRRPS